MTLQPTGLIKPFNLDPNEYDAMYNGPLPDKLTAILLVSGPLSMEVLWEGLDRYLGEEDPEDFPDEETEDSPDSDSEDESAQDPNMIIQRPAFLSPESVGLSVDIALSSSRSSHWRTYSRGWNFVLPYSDDFWDIQLVFLNDSRSHYISPLDVLFTAMDVYDYLWMTSHSLASKDHGAFPIDARTAETFRLIVGDIFRPPWGFMNRRLVEYRNKILISVGALRYDLDPVAEYDRFIKAGGKHYLEYPKLCP